MRRVAAAIIAIALIAGGFFINGLRTDPERGKAPLRIWCVYDAEDACQSLASERVLVTIGSPLDIDGDIDGKTAKELFDAVITSAPWLARLERQGQLTKSQPLASSPFVIAYDPDEKARCARVTCLIKPNAQIALPPANTLAGSMFAAFAFSSDQTPEAPVLDYLGAGGASWSAFDNPLSAVTASDVIKGAVVLNASISTAKVSVVKLDPASVLQLEIAYLNDDKRIDDVAKSLIRELKDKGWDDSVPSPPGPSGEATVDAFTVLNK